MVLIYRTESQGQIRFILSYHRERKRMRQAFTALAAAKKEALFMAQRIQSGIPREAPKAHGEAEAGRLVDEAMTKLGLSAAPKELTKLRKGDGRKVLVACLLRQRTTAGNLRIAQRLAMGHSGPVSRLVKAAANPPLTMRELAKLFKLLKCDT